MLLLWYYKVNKSPLYYITKGILTMKEQFIEYLIEQGYSVETPSGKPSTVYDYPKRIDKVCKLENTTWEELAKNISLIVMLYDKGGAKEEQGRQSKYAVINALRRFSEYLATQ